MSKYKKRLVEDTTCTSMFLLPALYIGDEKLRISGFINAFLDDMGHEPHYDDSVYVLFKPHDFDSFSDFLVSERERLTIIDDYDYEEYVVVVYEFPKEFKDDYQLFLKGKYSQFSEKFKETFTKKVNGAITFQWRVITKDKELKEYWEEKLDIELMDEDEIWESPNYNKEILDINEVKKQQEV